MMGRRLYGNPLRRLIAVLFRAPGARLGRCGLAIGRVADLPLSGRLRRISGIDNCMTWGQLVGRRRRIGTVMIGMQGGGRVQLRGSGRSGGGSRSGALLLALLRVHDRVGIVQAGKTLSEDIRLSLIHI